MNPWLDRAQEEDQYDTLCRAYAVTLADCRQKYLEGQAIYLHDFGWQLPGMPGDASFVRPQSVEPPLDEAMMEASGPGQPGSSGDHRGGGSASSGSQRHTPEAGEPAISTGSGGGTGEPAPAAAMDTGVTEVKQETLKSRCPRLRTSHHQRLL